MYAERRSNLLSRPAPLILVIGVHVMIAYLLSISMGVIKAPKMLEAAKVVFIPENTQKEESPPPEMPKVKPELAPQPLDNPLPQIEVPPDVVAPPSDAPPSDTAPVASAPTGPVGAPAQDLKVKSRIEPTYPPSSRRAGEEGTVRLRILVDERGQPREVEVMKGSGFARLDQAAIDAVRKWRFVAASNGSQTITAWTQVAITFRLENA